MTDLCENRKDSEVCQHWLQSVRMSLMYLHPLHILGRKIRRSFFTCPLLLKALTFYVIPDAGFYNQLNYLSCSNKIPQDKALSKSLPCSPCLHLHIGDLFSICQLWSACEQRARSRGRTPLRPKLSLLLLPTLCNSVFLPGEIAIFLFHTHLGDLSIRLLKTHTILSHTAGLSNLVHFC